MREQIPHDRIDRPIMGVDQKRPTLLVCLSRGAGEMDLLHIPNG